MAAGLAACSGRAAINGISQEPEKMARILPLVRQHEGDIIAYLLRPDGQVPVDAAGRMEAAIALFDTLQRADIRPERILFDPVVVPLAWQDGNRQNMAVLEVIRTLPDLLGYPVRTIAGLSNLTTGAPDPEARCRYQKAFLPMLAAAGIDTILMNVLDSAILDIARSSRNITGGEIFTWQ
jgi:5-methyltetrahydrofolate corrinoid/iron sulfur protein methyltransferase